MYISSSRKERQFFQQRVLESFTSIGKKVNLGLTFTHDTKINST